ncbi:MAG TPA: lysophospholipid acyltransferase family protein [Polyangiales bacterium]|nr:lysophospholipid acyltransferase family protein [Polyangiales bacterium]
MSKKPKSAADKRVGAAAARSVSTKATKSQTVPPPAKAKPPTPPKGVASKSAAPEAKRKSVAPPAPKASLPSRPTVPAGPRPKTTKIAEIAERLAERDAAEAARPKPEPANSGAKAVDARGSSAREQAKAERVRAIAEAATREAKNTYWGTEPDAPLADLRISAAAEAATVAPPKSAAKESADADEEIWSDDPVPSALVHEEGSRLTRGFHGDQQRAAADFGSSQSLLSTDYYFRQYGAHGLRNLSAEVDDFGFDPHVDEKLRPVLDLVSQKYFRVELVGAENLPAVGRALMVANRGGTLPWDGLVLRSALRNARPELSPVRWLAEDSVIHYPFMGVVMNRLGAVRACPENAERLLSQDRLVAVFPEGAQGSRKLFRDRYRLQRFGRGGYVKLALKLGVPIFPTAIIGAEDTNPVLHRSRLLGRFFGSDTVPITATFPWFGLAGLLPAPVRWRIAIGEPIDLSSYGPDAADDALVVHRLNEQIRASLQALVDDSKSARGSSLFG